MNEKVTLRNLIEALALRHQMDSKDADAFVKAFFELIRRALERDKYVKIKGLGTFKRIETEIRTSADEEEEHTGGTQSRFKVTFTPDASMRDLINKPFSHFETVVLNENTHFDDMNEDVSDHSSEKEESETTETEIPEQKEEPLDSQEADIRMEESPVSQPVEKGEDAVEESHEDVPHTVAEEVEESEVNVSVVQPEENTSATAEEQVVPTIALSENNLSEESSREEERNKLPWCMLATILLVGVLIGGGIIWALLSGRRYIPESLFQEIVSKKQADAEVPEKEHTERRKMPVAVVVAESDSIKEDTVIQKKDSVSSPKRINLTLPAVDAAPVSSNKLEAKSTKNEKPQTAKRETLADTVEYTITGTMDTYTLKNGESLVKVALKYYGNKKLWPYIVRHNRKIIKNPDNVPVGTILQIPKLTPKK